MGVNSLVPLAAAIIYIILLVVIILDHRWQKQQRFFALYLVAAMLWSFSTFLLRSDLLMEHKLLLFRVVILASVWWIVQLYYFVRGFLNLPGGLWIWFGYGSLATCSVGLQTVSGAWPGVSIFSNEAALVIVPTSAQKTGLPRRRRRASG